MPMKQRVVIVIGYRIAVAAAGLVTTVRRTRGEDVDAACGQLAGQVQDRTRRTIRLAQQGELRT